MRLPPFILVHFFGNCWSYKSIDWLIMKFFYWTVRNVIFSFSFFVLICLCVCVEGPSAAGWRDVRLPREDHHGPAGCDGAGVHAGQPEPGPATGHKRHVSCEYRWRSLKFIFLKEDLSTSSHSFSVGYPNFYLICYMYWNFKNVKWKLHKLCFS